VDFRRAFARFRALLERLRDLAAAALRDGFFFVALERKRITVFRDRADLPSGRLVFARLGFPSAFLTISLAAGTGGRPVAAAFPARAPTSPPMTAPAGPATLPSAAPATAPAVSFEIGGISMFSAAGGLSLFRVSGSSAIISCPSVVIFKTESHATATAAVPPAEVRLD